jgi:hypothetical protein
MQKLPNALSGQLIQHILLGKAIFNKEEVLDILIIG